MKTLNKENVARMVDASVADIFRHCQEEIGAAGDIEPLEAFALNNLLNELTERICRIVEASSPDNELDNEEIVRSYIFSDTHHEEDFSDIEICCEEDLDDAVERIDEYLDAFSPEEMAALADLIRSGAKFDLIEGGWSVDGEFFPKRKPSIVTGYGVYTDALEWKKDANQIFFGMASEAIRDEFASRFERKVFRPENFQKFLDCYCNDETENTGFAGAITDSINDRYFDGAEVFTSSGSCIYVEPYIPFDEDDMGYSPTQKQIQDILRFFLGPLTESPVDAQWIG